MASNPGPQVFRCEPAAEYFFQEGCHIIEVLNDAGSPNLSIARARVEPGVTTAVHWLIGTVEHYLIQSGVGRVFLGNNDVGQDVAPGDVVRIPEGCEQSITNTGSDDLIFHAVCSPRFDVANYRAEAD